MGTNIDAGTKLELCVVTLHQPIRNVGGVLPVHHAKPFLQRELVSGVGEDGQTVFQAKALQKRAYRVGVGGSAEVVGGECVGAVVDTEDFFDLIQHHHAPVRSCQRGDQPAVKAPGIQAGDGSGGIAAQPIGHNPFAVKFSSGLIDFDVPGPTLARERFPCFSLEQSLMSM